MHLLVEARCNVGARRQSNQDMILVGDRMLRDDVRAALLDTTQGPVAIAVADGMGGHASGARASAMACTTLRACALALGQTEPYADVQSQLAKLLHELHQAMRAECGTTAGHATAVSMGTTLTAVMANASTAVLAHAGDSRAYRFRDGILLRLTRDHSVREMLDPAAPRNQLANSVGAGEAMFLEVNDLTDRLIPGDRLLLCSDGLTCVLEDEEIEKLMTDLNPGDTADALLAGTFSRGAPDNVSILLAEILGSDEDL